MENISVHFNWPPTNRKRKGVHEDGPAEAETSHADIVALEGASVADSTNSVFVDDYSVTLRIRDTVYSKILNLPTLKSLTIEQRLMLGFPVLAKAKRKDKAHELMFQWFAFTADDFKKSSKDFIDKIDFDFDRGVALSVMGVSSLANESRSFITPSEQLLGHHLVVVCTPVSSSGTVGLPSAFLTKSSVQAAVRSEFIFTARQEGLMPLDSERLRVVSYNVLADLYVKPGAEGFFPYCDPNFITCEYRYPLLLREIQGYHSDVACLQEVDVKFCSSYLRPFLAEQDYALCDMAQKGGDGGGEGCVTVYRTSKLELVLSDVCVLSDILMSADSGYPDCAPLLAACANHADTQELITTRPTVVQLAAFRVLHPPRDRPRLLLVANTHLFFHVDWPHIKLMQMILCIRALQRAKMQLQEQYSSSDISVLFCGDYNSSPDTKAFQFAVDGSVPEGVWHSGVNADGSQYDFYGPYQSHSLKLSSASGTPEFTNYTAGFKGCLDYIFADGTARVTSVLSSPSEECLSEFIAIPSIAGPSDHIAQVVDLELV